MIFVRKTVLKKIFQRRAGTLKAQVAVGAPHIRQHGGYDRSAVIALWLLWHVSSPFVFAFWLLWSWLLDGSSEPRPRFDPTLAGSFLSCQALLKPDGLVQFVTIHNPHLATELLALMRRTGTDQRGAISAYKGLVCAFAQRAFSVWTVFGWYYGHFRILSVSRCRCRSRR